MDNDVTFNVVSTGNIVDGFERADVQQQLVSVMRVKPEQARQFFDKRRVLKKGLLKADAEKFSGRLAKLGVATEIESVVPQFEDSPIESKPAHQESVAAGGVALELAPDQVYAKIKKPDAVQCPNCSHEQAKSEQCEKCGIWFHKLEAAAHTRSTTAPESAAFSHPTTPPLSDDDPIDSADSAEASELSLAAFFAAAGAALVGAWVWRFVGVTFEYEFGIIAWAIGGAVGVAAASFGSRGAKAGVICGALVLMAMVLGKYWTYSAFADEFQQMIAGMTEEGENFYAYYEEESEDARLLVEGSGTDGFVRQYMVDRSYTDAIDPQRVSAQELAEFRKEIEPALREVAVTQPDYEQWLTANLGMTEELSPWAMMREGFGLLDIVFLALGIGTAFRLGSQMG